MKFAIIFLLFSFSVMADCLKVGVLGEFSTTTSSTSFPYGQEIYRGLEIAKKNIKENCFDLIKIDINNNIANIDGLIRKNVTDNKIKYFVGLGTSEQSHAAIKAINETNSYLLTPTATDDDLLKASKNIIFLSPLNSQMAQKLALESKNRGIKKVAIIYGKNNVYSQSMAKLYQQEAIKQGIEISYQAPIRIGRRTKIEALDFDQLKKADAIFLPIFEHDVVKTFGHLHKNNALNFVFGSDSWGSDSRIISTLPKEIKSKILFSITSYDANRLKIKENKFYQQYMSLHSNVPMDIAAFSYESLIVLTQKQQNLNNIKYLGTTGEVQILDNVAHRDIFIKSL